MYTVSKIKDSDFNEEVRNIYMKHQYVERIYDKFLYASPYAPKRIID